MIKMKRILLILIAGAVIFLAAVYLIYQPKIDRFPSPTTINKIDVSGLTAAEADKKIAENRKSKEFSFIYNGAVFRVPLSSLTFRPDSGKVLTSLSRLEKFRYFFKLRNEYEIPVNPESSEEFMSLITDMPFCDNTGKEKTTDAYVDLSDFDFRTVEEKIGTEVDPNNIRDIALTHIDEGSFSAELTEENMVKQPGLRADSDEFRKLLKYYRDNLDYKLEYEIDGKMEVVTPEILNEMADYSGEEPKLDDDRIGAFILDIAGRCNEYNASYKFKTHGGSNITVKGVTFGKVIDKPSMTEDLKEALKAQEARSMELKWAQEKYNGGEGIGDSYIETSIADQHVWCYKDGKCVVDCDCVTGAPGHDTARGVFVAQTVTGPTVLKGDNGDGTRYESPVNCFIPFYDGQGYHGSNGWRSQWGGEIYKTNGSHGCVNCPDAAAKKIAGIVSYGYPVVIY